MRRARPLLATLLFVLVFGTATAAGERVEVVAAAELYLQPGGGSRGWVEAGQTGERLARSGGWVQVRLADRQGWLRIWQVRAADEGAGNALLRGLQRFSRGIAGLFGGNDAATVEGDVTVTIGVRGLDAGEFVEAAPDPAALRRARGLRASPAEAEAFARAAGLQRRPIAAPAVAPSQDWEDW